MSKSVPAPLTAEQQARRDAELAKKEEDKKKAAEEQRHTLALLATYSSEKDINSARDRALAEVDKNLKQSQQRLEDAKKKKTKLDADKEFYKGKPLPDPVKAQIKDNEKEIAAQQAAIAAKIKEAEEVRSRFAEEKKRYLELTGGKTTDQKLREVEDQTKALNKQRRDFLYTDAEQRRIAEATRKISEAEDRANRGVLTESAEDRSRARRAAAASEVRKQQELRSQE